LTAEGRYLYCVTDASESDASLGNIGIEGSRVFGVAHEDLTAVVSPIPFKTMETALPTILVHQKVVEACRARATTLPVRFGVIFKGDKGVKEMLARSYSDYRAKLTKLRGKEEFGAKVILDETGLRSIRAEVEKESAELGKLKKAAVKASKGTSYLLKLRTDEALRTEVAKKIQELSRGVHSELGSSSLESALLKSEHDKIILNAAYLVDVSRRERFQAEAARVKQKYEKEGLAIHLSGPWAPYSFC
jgi:hypothetical protein